MAEVLISGVGFPPRWMLVAAQSGNCWGNSLINSATHKGTNSNYKQPPLTDPPPSPPTPPPRLHPHTFLRGEGVFFFYNSDLIEFQFTEYVDNHICVLSLQSSMETCSRVPAETRCAANKGHSPVSPSEEFYLEFLCATELWSARRSLRRAFTGTDPAAVIP